MRIALLVSGILLTFFASSQQTLSKTQFDKKYYLQKSRQQKTLGTVSMITGSLTAAVGGYIWFLAPIAGLSESGDVEGAKRTGRTMVIVGGSLIGASIPLFIASKKNKEKASLYAGALPIYLPMKGYDTQLAIGIRIPLR